MCLPVCTLRASVVVTSNTLRLFERCGTLSCFVFCKQLNQNINYKLLHCNTLFSSDVAFVKVEIKMITNNIKNSLKTLSYHFDFYVGEKYMECLLVDFSDYNRCSIVWGYPIISDDQLLNLNRFPPLAYTIEGFVLPKHIHFFTPIG